MPSESFYLATSGAARHTHPMPLAARGSWTGFSAIGGCQKRLRQERLRGVGGQKCRPARAAGGVAQKRHHVQGPGGWCVSGCPDDTVYSSSQGWSSLCAGVDLSDFVIWGVSATSVWLIGARRVLSQPSRTTAPRWLSSGGRRPPDLHRVPPPASPRRSARKQARCARHGEGGA